MTALLSAVELARVNSMTAWAGGKLPMPDSVSLIGRHKNPLCFQESSFVVVTPTMKREFEMAKEKKSYDMHVELPEGVTREEMMRVVERAAEAVGLYISHIGSYSRKKFPNSVHWHFKRDKKENGLIDATFWDVKSLLWLMIRNREPDWVHKTAPVLRNAMAAEVAKLKSA